MLKITNDGRKLALDRRLVNGLLPDNSESKIAVCAEKSYEIWKDTAAQKSAQWIFCDLSTPKDDGSFNVYDDLKQKLIEKGVKERREQQVAEKNESREAVPRAGVEINTAVKDAGKAERKAVVQKKTMPEKEKKPSIHERLEINKRIIQEKQGKDKPERGADLGVR